MPLDDIHLDRDLSYLQAELARIDILVRRQVSRIQSAEAHGQDEDRTDAIWLDLYQRAVQHSHALATASDTPAETLKLARLARIFQLDKFELDAFLIVLAPALDQKYAELYSYLQSNAALTSPRVSLVLDLLCESTAEKWQMLARFSDQAPLMRYLIAPESGQSSAPSAPRMRRELEPDPAVVDWLLGSYQPRGVLQRHAYLLPPQGRDSTDLILSAEIWPQIEEGVREQTLACFWGADRECQDAVARRMAHVRRRPLLTVDLDAAAESIADIEQLIHLGLRDARLTQSVVHFTGIDVCLTDGILPATVMQQFDQHPGLIITSGAVKWRLIDTRRDGSIFWQEFPVPSYPQRKTLWRHLLGHHLQEGEEQPSDEEIARLAGQFHLTSGQTRDVVDTARDLAIRQGAQIGEQDLRTAARDYSSTNLAALATKIRPRYRWSDLILPAHYLQILEEIVATVRDRPIVLEDWGVGKKLVSSAAVTMLFAGEPGTGKTMAAEVIANELGIDLFKINLSTMVSKYIGETEKNLERIFCAAEQSNAILFFDEADALFGKRTAVKDSHDRYANIGVSYLLQRMEIYDGVTILATNLRSSLDEAFTRRLQFLVDFPFPDAASRLRIWQALFPPSVPCDPNVDFAVLAERLRLAGGNIRNIIVTAAYLAADRGQEVTMEILQHAVRRELQKMGRIIDERKFSDPDDRDKKKAISGEMLENTKLVRDTSR